MEGVGWRLLVDFAVLTTAIYVVLHWSRQARALRVTFGILVLEAGALAASRAGLALTSFVLHGATIIAVVALIVLFQPELRHAINRLEVTAGTSAHRNAALTGLEAIAAAAFSLAAAHRGALIVVQRRDAINELIQGGVPLGGQLSVEILEAIFRKVSPVHDGAAVVEGDHITRVGTLLPLSQRSDLPRSWGTRHRAGMGLAERSDAVVIVGSEERGEVVVMFDGQFHPVANPSELVVVLRAAGAAPALSPRLRPFDRQELTIFGLAVALAAAIVATLVLAGNTLQVRSVPIEFANVGRGLRIADPSTATGQLRLRGSSWMLTSVDPARLVLRVSVAGMGPGMHTVTVDARSVTLPFGVTVDGVSPDRISVLLAPETEPTRKSGQ